jgi:predicted dehydrogenase
MEAAKKSGKVVQVGSQRVSSIGYAKAKELVAAGEIGKLNMVNAVYDRQSSIGAWEYTIPKDASALTTNWDQFIEATEKWLSMPRSFSGGVLLKNLELVWLEIYLSIY